MSGYVRATEFKGEFEGETVTAKLEQMSLPDLLTLQGTDVETDEDAATVLASIVPKYVKDFVGPKAADGSAVTVEEVCGKAYFLKLSMALGRKLVEAAKPPQVPSETSAS